MDFGVGNFSLVQSFALILALLFFAQIISGLILVAALDLSIDAAWSKLQSILIHNWYFWLIRDFHMLNANFVMFAIYCHGVKGVESHLSNSRKLVWFLGCIILVLGLALCFSGYVLVFGQMSYWALIVILNLITILPVIDDILLSAIYGGTYAQTWTVGRILTLHFLCGIIAALVSGLHLISIHRIRPAGSNFSAADGCLGLFDVILKDLSIIGIVSALIFVPVIEFLIHPDNFGAFSRLVTPAHIEPEAYFLYLFCILKSRAVKIVGCVALLNLNSGIILIIVNSKFKMCTMLKVKHLF